MDVPTSIRSLLNLLMQVCPEVKRVVAVAEEDEEVLPQVVLVVLVQLVSTLLKQVKEMVLVETEVTEVMVTPAMRLMAVTAVAVAVAVTEVEPQDCV